MKQFLFSILFAISASSSLAQLSRECCPHSVTVTLTQSQVQNLHTTPITLVTPTVGSGIRLVKPAVMWTHGDPAGFGFASGEYLEIFNDATVMPVMQQFTDPAITEDGMYSAYFFQTYEIIENGQTVNWSPPFVSDGSIKIRTSGTQPITGGSPGSTITIKLWYELFAY